MLYVHCAMLKTVLSLIASGRYYTLNLDCSACIFYGELICALNRPALGASGADVTVVVEGRENAARVEGLHPCSHYTLEVTSL